MNKILAGVLSGLVVLGIVGCGPSYVGQNIVPAQQSQSVISGTCINAQQQVMEDYYCDPNWIAQQRVIAQQQNNQAMLNSLLLYHMIYTPTPYYVGAYIPHTAVIYTRPPVNYIVQRRSTYVTNVNNHSINYQPGKGATTVVQRTTTIPQSQSSSWSSRFRSTTQTPSSTTTTTQSITSRPSITQSTSRPTTSYSMRTTPNSSSSPTFGTRSSSSSSYSSSSSFSRGSSSSSFGSRRR